MFKWCCLVLAVLFLSVLTWMVKDIRQGTWDLHEATNNSKPRATLEGEVIPLMVDGKPAQAITVSYNPPFVSPPALTFPEGNAGWKVTTNQADFFNLSRTGAGSEANEKLRWKAEGQPAKTKLEEHNEALLRAFQQLQNELFRQDSNRRMQNEQLLQELRALRQDVKKLVEGQPKK